MYDGSRLIDPLAVWCSHVPSLNRVVTSCSIVFSMYSTVLNVLLPVSSSTTHSVFCLRFSAKTRSRSRTEVPVSFSMSKSEGKSADPGVSLRTGMRELSIEWRRERAGCC